MVHLCVERDEYRVSGCSYQSCYGCVLLTLDGATVVTGCSPRHNIGLIVRWETPVTWTCDTWLPFANCVFFLFLFLCPYLSYFTTEIVTALLHALSIAHCETSSVATYSNKFTSLQLQKRNAIQFRIFWSLYRNMQFKTMYVVMQNNFMGSGFVCRHSGKRKANLTDAYIIEILS